MGHRPQAVRRLADVGITTVKELAAADPESLKAARSARRPGRGWCSLGHGHGSRSITGTPYVARGKSRETTFQTEPRRLGRGPPGARVAGPHGSLDDVVAEDRQAVRVTVKVRFAPFFTSTHGQKLDAAHRRPRRVEQAALAALEKFTDRRPVRLLGVRAEMTPGPPPTADIGEWPGWRGHG